MGMNVQSGGSKGRATLSEINVTPLVDVMLVLLIIFMVTAPMLQQEMNIDLPQANSPQQISEEQLDSVVIVSKATAAERSVMFRGSMIPYDKIAVNEPIKEAERIYLYAERTLIFQEVATVLSKLRQAGVKNLSIITDKEE